MIDFGRLEKEKDILREKFLTAKPFSYIIIDNFLKDGFAKKLHSTASASIKNRKLNKVYDPIFSKNKYQYPQYKDLSDEFNNLNEEIMSEKFSNLISHIVNSEIFFDNDFYGGGLHLGAKNSHLDMHADFNYHPKHQNWFRNINLLLYLNKDWKKEYGGSLKLKDARNGEKLEIEPLINRLVIMNTRDYTLHGYDTIHFPKDAYRISIAMYGYSLHETHISKPRSTLWVVESNVFKKALAKIWTPASRIKKKIFN